tara:strand:+ start:360 stop:1169 length:810 start_codon:yes stop_codon:yes gene_type:complete
MKFLLLLISFFLVSCSQNSIETRYNLIDSLNSNKFDKKIYTTSYYSIYSLEKIKNDGKLIIYIEGDGVSWVDRFTISSNPTPNNPTAFKLALIDENDNVIYLARPCQFEWSNNCDKDTWTLSQYSISVLSGYKSIIEELSEKYEEIHLVGYSGGAGIGMYLAGIGNKSVKSIRTVAGNINHNALTQMLNISKLSNSLNFYPIVKKTNNIPQIHYYGLEDRTVPNQLQISYKNKNADNNCINIKPVNATHDEGWEAFWSKDSSVLPSQCR